MTSKSLYAITVGYESTPALSEEKWAGICQRVIQGGKRIIELRGRSSFQSPAYVSVEMIRAAMGGAPFRWPAGTYVHSGEFKHLMMALETTIDHKGVHYKVPHGTPRESAELRSSYEHLVTLRDEVIGIPVDEWGQINEHLK